MNNKTINPSVLQSFSPSTEYLPFSSFLFRTPLLPVNTFFQEMEKLEKEESSWKQFLQDSLIREAIFLASPVLHDKILIFLNSCHKS